MKAKIGRRLTDEETKKAAVLAAYIDGSPHEWPEAVSEVALVCHGYLDQQARIRELEAELAEARANLAKADDGLNSAAYDLERQGRELADARKDTERLAWCSLHKACAVEYWGGGWRVQNIYQVFMTDSHETPRAAIDAAMKTDWKVSQ